MGTRWDCAFLRECAEMVARGGSGRLKAGFGGKKSKRL